MSESPNSPQGRIPPLVRRLLLELDAKRFHSETTLRIIELPNPLLRLLRAGALAQEGKYSAARADVDDALARGIDDALVELAAGIVLYTTRDYQRALDRFERVIAISDRGAHRARQQIVDAAGSLGWDLDVRQTLEAAISAEPDDPGWHAQAVRFFASGRHWSRALGHARRTLELVPHYASMWMEAAALHGHLGHRDQALDAIERALELAKPGQELLYRREAARVAIDASDFEQAMRCLHRAIELDPEAPDLHVQLAELHSWKGDDPLALFETNIALSLDPAFPPALRMQGALEVRAGRYEQAIPTLIRAIELDIREYRSHVWLSEAYLRLHRYDEAHAQLHHGTMNSGGPLLVVWMIRFLIVAYHEQSLPKVLPPNRSEEFAELIRELCPKQASHALSTMLAEDMIIAVEAAMKALRGNRSIQATHVVDGRLTRLRARTGCRHDSRWALQLLRVASAEECLVHYDELIPKYPGSSLALCHRGELHLWLGNLEQAKADLEEAIAIVMGTRWAYMGLSMLRLLDQDYEGCLEINARGVEVMRHSEGLAIHVYRGEAKRKLGRVDAAIVELEKAVEAHPSRASATINLALCYAIEGEEASLTKLWRRLCDQQAAGLLSDAAYELGVTIHGDKGWEPDDAIKVAVLERALNMMGANRSSGLLTYWTAAGRLRFVPRWPHGGRTPHDNDRHRLQQVKHLVLKALAHRGGR